MITTLLLFTTFFLIVFRLSMKSFWKRLGINDVPGFPIVGNIAPVFLRKTPFFQQMEKLYKRGEGRQYIGIYNGAMPALLIRDPDLIEIMLREESKNFEDRGMFPDASDPLSLTLFSLNGKLWRWTRAKLRPGFSNVRLKTAYEGIVLCTQECFNTLGSSVNIKNTLEEYTCNVIAKTVYCVQDSSGFIENSHKAFSLSGFSGIGVLLRLFFPRFALFLGIKTVPQETENFYRKALERSVRVPGSFLDLMFHLKETEPDFTDDLMLAQFFIFLLAGLETTSSALTFALYLLAKNPTSQKKARIEVERIFKEQGRSFETLKHMTYLDFVINETLRLYPPITGMVRYADKPFRLPCGAVLPAGSGVSIQIYALHRDPRYYEDPLEFIPERWEQPHKVFYPFGLGPRLCIGMKFAQLQMKMFLSSLLVQYEIKLNARTEEPIVFDPSSLFYKPKTPILLDFEKKI